MKTMLPRLGFILAVATATALADDPAPAAKAADDTPAGSKPAAAVSRQITAGITYSPPPPAETEPKPGDQVKPGDPAANPDLLVLPKMTVKQKPRPRLVPEVVLTRQGLGDELAKKKFGQFDQALNKFTLPLFGRSIAERALDEYEREKKQQLNLDVLSISQALEQADSAEAKSLKDAAAKATANAPAR